ncbi:MAG: hypothetical protein JXB48_17020 [Candidatus Latescibacteria bacterium]|nr:hypothetical protein [Candidatus Latescibacterota bacterium]
MIFRLTQKLAKKIHSLDTLNDLPLAGNPFADWSANLFRARRLQYIIVTNTVSLYSMLLNGRGIADNDDFIIGVRSTLRLFMEADGNDVLYRKYIETDDTPEMFAKSLNRSVNGSMNDFIEKAKYHLEYSELSLYDTAQRLNEMPMSYLNLDNPKIAFSAMASKK